MIKYQYAFNSNLEIVNITNLSKESKNLEDKFICISCEKELIPRIGEIREKHFAHKDTINCSSETYLHNLGKKLFLQEYNKCKKEGLPFNIELTHNKICNVCINSEIKFDFICNVGSKSKKYNLLNCFPEIELEKKIDDFVPDILLYNKERKEIIFVEIAVTHSSEVKKIKSSNRIIELNITEEEDLDTLKNHLLSEDDEKMKFYNFIKKDIFDLQKQKECKKEFDLFILYKSGKCILKNSVSINEALLNLSYKSIQSYEISETIGDEDDFLSSSKYKYFISKMHLKNFNVKNCYICKHHEISSDYFDPVYCKKLRLSCGSNKAAECENYFIDYEIVKSYKNYKEGNK